MAIEFDCGQCGKPLFAQDQFAGRPIKCPGCGLTMTIPAPAGSTVPPPLPAPNAGPPPVAPGTLSVSDMVTVAYQAYTKNIWLGAALNTIVLMWKMTAIGLLLFEGQTTTWQDHLRPGYIAVILFVWSVDAILWSGLVWTGVKMSDQAIGVPVPATPADFFAPLSRPLAILGAWFPFLVGLEATKILCEILFPGQTTSSALASVLILFTVNAFYYARLYMAVPLILDRKLGTLDALRESLRITQGHSGVVLAVLLLAGLSYMVGGFMCIVGLIFTGTFGLCLTGTLYRNLTVQK